MTRYRVIYSATSDRFTEDGTTIIACIAKFIIPPFIPQIGDQITIDGGMYEVAYREVTLYLDRWLPLIVIEVRLD